MTAAKTAPVRLGNFYASKHTYEIGTDKGQIHVDADTRNQAAKIAKTAGYVVRDVNMIG